jgi:hypothetical protein
MLITFASRTHVRLVWLVLLAVAAVGWSSIAGAATHSVAPDVSNVDCRSFSGGVRPGDTLVLRGRSRGSIKFSNCFGTQSQPIAIQNDASESGALVIKRSGGNTGLECTNCENVVIDGTGKWAGAPAGICGATIADGEWQLGTRQCGIVVQCVAGSSSPHLIRLDGSSKRVTVKGVEVDGNYPACSRGTAISVNDHKYRLSEHPGEWREGFLLTRNYIHDTAGSGIYFGPNQAAGKGEGDLQVRNNEISHNYVNMTGCDGIKYKSVIMGESRIHHNYVTHPGQKAGTLASGCVSNGIALYEGGYTEIFSNYVEAPTPKGEGKGNCITHSTQNLSANKVAKLPAAIYNNVVRNCKGKGISAQRANTSNPQLQTEIYNNTIVAPLGDSGIRIDQKINTCVVRDNVLAGVKLDAAQCNPVRNFISGIAAVNFSDAQVGDFSLTANSPAVDGGGGQCPSEDMLGNERPHGGSCDQGAFEYIDGQLPPIKPSPPALLAVE